MRQGRDKLRPRQSLILHIQELRERLFWWVLVFIAGAIGGYFLSDTLQYLLAAPLGQPLYYTSPAGGFNFVFQICLLFGLLVSIPVLIYQLVRFVEPALPNATRSFISTSIVTSILLALGGAAFAYFISLPAALHFLNSFTPDNIKSLISTDAYMSFASWYIGGFAILFQLPLIVLIVNRITPLGPGPMLRKLHMIVLASFMIAAVLTPTADPFNQAIMAGPIIILYILSAGIVAFVNRKRKLGPKDVKRIELALFDGQQPYYYDLPVQNQPEQLMPLQQSELPVQQIQQPAPQASPPQQRRIVRL